MPERMPDRMLEYMSDRMSQYMSDKLSEYIEHMKKIFILKCHGGDNTKFLLLTRVCFLWVVAVVFYLYCFQSCWEVWNDIQIAIDDSECLYHSCDTTVIHALYDLIGVTLYR